MGVDVYTLVDMIIKYTKGKYSNNYLFVNMLKERFDVCDDDLIYFNIAGNMINVMVLADGYSLCHILGLREYNKTQWETRAIFIVRLVS